MKKLLLLWFSFLTFSSLSSQELSEKQEIALFPLTSLTFNVNWGLMADVDEKIKAVFINMRRFKVIGLSFRLNAISLDQFIFAIRKTKEQSANFGAEIQFGDQFLTVEEYNKVISAFLVVVPQIVDYRVSKFEKETYEEKTEKHGTQNTIHKTRKLVVTYKTHMELSFTIYQASDMIPIRDGIFHLSANEEGQTPYEATQKALGDILARLKYTLSSIEQFRIKSGVREVRNDEATIKFGHDMGISVGDEYVLEDISRIGTEIQKKESGLLIIKEVQDTSSVGHIVYGHPYPGMAVQELPRIGVKITPYALYGRNFFSPTSSNNVTLGFNFLPTQWFFNIKPLFGIESSLTPLWFSCKAYIGIDFTCVRLGRFELSFSTSFVTGPMIDAKSISEPTTPVLLLGLRPELKGSYLITRDIELSLTAIPSLLLWYGLQLEGGLGLVFKL